MLAFPAQTRATAERMSELRSQHQAEVAALLARYRALRGNVAGYNKAVESVISGAVGAASTADGGAGGRDQA